jgi:hypothetical protein
MREAVLSAVILDPRTALISSRRVNPRPTGPQMIRLPVEMPCLKVVGQP